MKRRDFLVLTGAAGVAVALEGCTRLGSTAGSDGPEVLPGIESFVMTTCLMCPGGCGIKVRRVDGDPKGIAGNPNHPINAGGVCTEGISALQLLYHPNRLTRPMRRKGAKGSGEFEPVSWDVALKTITDALKQLQIKKANEKLAFILGRSGGSMEELVRHFMRTWNSPKLFLDLPRDGYPQVLQAMHGLSVRPAFDFDNADFVFAFGADLLNAWDSPLQFQRSYSNFRNPGRSQKSTLAVADIRFSLTATHAHEWVGVAPGSHGALALGIAYVMLRENQYDPAFAEEHLYGFNDFEDPNGRGTRLGYRSLVLRDYSPEVVSRLTGVPVERIINLGKAFGESTNALALFDQNVTSQPGGLYAGMAIHSLNLLKGNLNRPGGIYLQPKVPLLPLTQTPPGTAASNIGLSVEDLAPLASSGGAEIAFLYYSNPIYSTSLQGQMREALGRIGLVVSFSPFLDETSRYADFILPDALPLERWEDSHFPLTSPISGWGVVQPCIQAAGEARHAGEVLLDVAHGLGGTMAAALPWKNFEEILKTRARGLYLARAGGPISDPFDAGLLGQIESRGYWVSDNGTFDEFWQKLLDSGAWSDPNYRVRSLHDYSGNADGRVDLYSRELHRRLLQSDSSVPDVECLPHYHSEADRAVGLDRQITLNPYRPGKLQGGANGMLPWARLAATPLDRLAGDPWAEINAQDAHANSIRDLDWIWIESTTGKIKVRALIYPGAAPGVVNVPFGLGAIGQSGKDRGINPLELIVPQRDPLSGLTYRFGTKVKIYKA